MLHMAKRTTTAKKKPALKKKRPARPDQRQTAISVVEDLVSATLSAV